MPTVRLLLEVFSIVLAVLLALGVNEWRQHRQNQQLAQTALRAVDGESAASYRQLGLRVEAHEALSEKLRTVQDAFIREQPLPDSPLSTVDMGIYTLRSSAFRSAQAMQALPHMQPGIVTRLAELERGVQAIETFDDALRRDFNRTGYYQLARGDPYENPATTIDPFFAIGDTVNAALRNERDLREDSAALLRVLHERGFDVPLPTDSTSAAPGSPAPAR